LRTGVPAHGGHDTAVVPVGVSRPSAS
jgi:hypothetical protein